MVKQALDEAFVKMGEFMPVMLVNLSQDALQRDAAPSPVAY